LPDLVARSHVLERVENVQHSSPQAAVRRARKEKEKSKWNQPNAPLAPVEITSGTSTITWKKGVYGSAIAASANPQDLPCRVRINNFQDFDFCSVIQSAGSTTVYMIDRLFSNRSGRRTRLIWFRLLFAQETK
jgi:hypothetical protein